eukprot:1091683-Pelagomonas_calceolata.AAC.1
MLYCFSACIHCRHLASCALVDLFSSRPALMITDAMDALTPSVDSTSRDIELLGFEHLWLNHDHGHLVGPCSAPLWPLWHRIVTLIQHGRFDSAWPLWRSMAALAQHGRFGSTQPL